MNIVLQPVPSPFTDRNAPATPPAKSDIPRPSAQTAGTAPAPRNRKQNPAIHAVSRPAPRPTPPIAHPAAAKYAKTHPSAPTVPHRPSTPPRCPAIPLAAPPPPAARKSPPAAAQTETLARCDHASARTSPRDGTARNAHRKKDIPRRSFVAPPEKHSTPAQRPYRARRRSSRRRARGLHPQAHSRRANRNYGNVPCFALATLSETL